MTVGVPVGPTTIAQQIAAVMADVTVGPPSAQASGIAAITGINVLIGRKAAKEHTDTPTVRWIPGAETFGPARKEAYPGGARALASRAIAFRVECWADSFDTADALWSAVAAALIRRYGVTVARITGAQWATNEASVTESGEVVTGAVTLEVAVLDYGPLAVKVTLTALYPLPIPPT